MKTFQLTEAHLILLSEMDFFYNDEYGFGSVCTDCKRPYGNSNVVDDVADILGISLPDDEDEGYDAIAREVADIHRETATALQVIIDCKTFKTGTYVSEDWNGFGNRPKWKKS